MEKLIELERTARLDKNEELQKNIFTEMTKLCESDDDLINLQILLSKRKGQLLYVFSWFVSYNFQRKKVYYENINKPDSQEKLIRYAECILKEVIEGNMFLERERIMISSFLKDCYEKEGELRKAMDIIFEVPIETFSNVSECEVIKYQLEQLRLAVINKDWIRAEVSSKKIRSKYFTEKKDIKKEIVYLSLLTDMNLGQKMYFNAAKLLYEMSEKSDSSNNYIFLSSFYTVISDKSKERDDFLNKLIYNQSNTESIRKILHSFLKTELLVKEDIFSFKEYVDLNIFEEEIIRALDVHNLTVISKYCTFINASELAVLLKCDTQQLIDKICYVVNNKLLQCKISEDDGLIMFNTNLQGNWIESITDILDKIVEVNHLIEDEYMKNDK